MTKKEYNLKFKSHIDECKVDFGMLIQGYALLDKQVSKYAYLKKKYANSGKTNESNIYELTQLFKNVMQLKRCLNLNVSLLLRI